METLRQLWNESGTTLGGWVSVPSSVTAEAVARAGFDYVCIDMQHGTNRNAWLFWPHIHPLILNKYRQIPHPAFARRRHDAV